MLGNGQISFFLYVILQHAALCRPTVGLTMGSTVTINEMRSGICLKCTFKPGECDVRW